MQKLLQAILFANLMENDWNPRDQWQKLFFSLWRALACIQNQCSEQFGVPNAFNQNEKWNLCLILLGVLVQCAFPGACLLFFLALVIIFSAMPSYNPCCPNTSFAKSQLWMTQLLKAEFLKAELSWLQDFVLLPHLFGEFEAPQHHHLSILLVGPINACAMCMTFPACTFAASRGKTILIIAEVFLQSLHDLSVVND